jgi:hypothetical protein
MNIYMTVGGKQTLITKLSVFDRESKRRITESIKKWTRVIYQEAVTAAPFGGTGVLIRNIRIEDPTSKRAIRGADRGPNSQDKLIGTVRSAAHHSQFIEFGTGQEGATSNQLGRPTWHHYHRRHKFPPWSKGALAKWAKGIGLNPYQVARKIYLRQGQKARPFLQPSLLLHSQSIISEIQNDVYSAAAETNAKMNKEIPTIGGGDG